MEYTPDIIELAACHMAAQDGIDITVPTKEQAQAAAAALEEAAKDGYRYVPVHLSRRLQGLPAGTLYPGVFVAARDMDAIEALDRPGQRITAICGTRDISYYGRGVTARMTESLTGGVLTVSFGLGVAQAAMRTALEKGIPVIAVPATGPGECYPYTMRYMLHTLAAIKGCAVVTPYFPHTDPSPIRFLYRNRITAALADEVLVAESKMHGGAMVTARLARDFGRDVYAAPGRYDDIRSMGCNDLIAKDVARIWMPGENDPVLPEE